MLIKLLKNDFRANLKVFLMVWPAMLIFGILSKIVISSPNSSLEKLLVLILPVFVLTILGTYIFALITTATRFYSGLLGKEGYLMFTLPAKPWQLILSKFIVALTTLSVTVIFAILSCFLLIQGVIDTYIKDFMFLDFGIDIDADMIPTILLFLAYISQLILQIYLACAVGHLFRKNRLLWTVLSYYGINVAIQTINSVLMLSSSEDSLSSNDTSSLWIALLANVAICAVYYFITERILSKKLNLE